MDQLSRKKAEQLITDENVKHTKLEQDKKELRVFIELTDGRTCLVKYNKSNGPSHWVDHPIVKINERRSKHRNLACRVRKIRAKQL